MVSYEKRPQRITNQLLYRLSYTGVGKPQWLAALSVGTRAS